MGWDGLIIDVEVGSGEQSRGENKGTTLSSYLIENPLFSVEEGENVEIRSQYGVCTMYKKKYKEKEFIAEDCIK